MTDRELNRTYLHALISASAENSQLREQLAAAVEALEAIKLQVCGDKTPRWKDDGSTTNTRYWIADRCDAELAKIKENTAK